MIVAEGHDSVRHGQARDRRKSWPAYGTCGSLPWATAEKGFLGGDSVIMEDSQVQGLAFPDPKYLAR